MAERKVKIWYDAEGDYLEVIFEEKAGYFCETSNDQVMEKVDDEGNILGFSVLKVSAVKKTPLDVWERLRRYTSAAEFLHRPHLMLLCM
jgi:uncharacterized protein YuzE